MPVSDIFFKTEVALTLLLGPLCCSVGLHVVPPLSCLGHYSSVVQPEVRHCDRTSTALSARIVFDVSM